MIRKPISSGHPKPMPDRRSALRAALAGVGAAVGTFGLTGCDRLSTNPTFARSLRSAQYLSEATQNIVAGPMAMAQEFSEADISPRFKANGTMMPGDADYRDLLASGFATWKLEVSGLVEKPAAFSLAELRAMPSRTQITRHDCVEGWSVIGKWKGVRLSHVLAQVRPQAAAKFVVFRCADSMDDPNADEDSTYYESISMSEARHAQTILAYDLNDKVLPVANGAPLRLRVERQLGYKQAKYLMSLELVADFADIRDGAGGYWEDNGYEWYAGI